MARDWQALPPLGPPKSRHTPPLDKFRKRRLTRLAVPSTKECSVIPALASVDGLLLEDNPIESRETIERRFRVHLQDEQRSSQATPASSQVLESQESSSVTHTCSNTASPTADLNEEEQAGHSKWHIMLLGRTFRDMNVREVADCLVDILDLGPSEARRKATSAEGATALVVFSCLGCNEARHKAEMLRSAGLRVQVASETGLPGSSSPSPPLGAKPPKRLRRESFADVFQEAKNDEARPKRRSVSCCSRRSRRVSLSDPMPKPKELRLKVLIEKHKEQLLTGLHSDFSLVHPSIVHSAMFLHSPSSEGSGVLRRRSLTPEIRSAQPHGLWKGLVDGLTVHTGWETLTNGRIQASAVLRFLAFGEIRLGRESADDKLSYHDSIGTKQQIHTLVTLWRALDEDRSDRVDLVEFKQCAQRRLVERFEELSPSQVLPSWATLSPSGEASSKLIHRLCDKMAAELFGKKSSFSLDDLMSLLWLRASSSDLRTMKSWWQEITEEATRMRVKTPPVLDPVEHQDLCSVFKHFDSEHRKELSFDELVSLGLVYPDQVAQTREEWDKDGNGKLDMVEFCEMMCPSGYRATTHSTIGTLDDSRIVVFDSRLDRWQLQQGSPDSDAPIVDTSS